MSPIIVACFLGVVGYLCVAHVTPRVGSLFVQRGLSGRDMSKLDSPIIPETMGIIPAITYIFIMMCFAPIMSFVYNFKLSFYLGSLLCIQSMVLLGLLDDLFDIRWRHKFFLPAIASIPLLVVYALDFNITSILLPSFLHNFGYGPTLDLSFGYYIYMASVAIFCPNSVNILAGINGLEVGQTVVIAILLIINDLYYISGGLSYEAFEVHIYSLCFLIPFLGVALALLKMNWCPAKVFVGDTWCYFSGMVFAVVGISSHYVKTLMLFFLPQIGNFIYSAPQLFGLVPCPRHRLPKFNKDDGLMYNSWTVYTHDEVKGDGKLKPVMIPVFNILEKLYLIKLQRDPKDNKTIIASSNMTLINLVIIWFGPKSEGNLCTLIMGLQFTLGVLMLILRHTLGPVIFGFDNSWNMLNSFY